MRAAGEPSAVIFPRQHGADPIVGLDAPTLGLGRSARRGFAVASCRRLSGIERRGMALIRRRHRAIFRRYKFLQVVVPDERALTDFDAAQLSIVD